MCTALIRSIFTNMYAVIPAAAAAAVQCRVSSLVEMSLANNRTDPLLYSEWRYTAMPSLGKTTVANKDGQPATHIYGHFRLHCWIIVSQIKYLLHKIHRRPAKNKVTFFSPWYACILFIHKLFSVSNQLVFDYISIYYIQFLKDSSKSTKSEKKSALRYFLIEIKLNTVFRWFGPEWKEVLNWELSAWISDDVFVHNFPQQFFFQNLLMLK